MEVHTSEQHSNEADFDGVLTMVSLLDDNSPKVRSSVVQAIQKLPPRQQWFAHTELVEAVLREQDISVLTALLSLVCSFPDKSRELMLAATFRLAHLQGSIREKAAQGIVHHAMPGDGSLYGLLWRGAVTPIANERGLMRYCATRLDSAKAGSLWSSFERRKEPFERSGAEDLSVGDQVASSIMFPELGSENLGAQLRAFRRYVASLSPESGDAEKAALYPAFLVGIFGADWDRRSSREQMLLLSAVELSGKWFKPYAPRLCEQMMEEEPAVRCTAAVLIAKVAPELYHCFKDHIFAMVKDSRIAVSSLGTDALRLILPKLCESESRDLLSELTFLMWDCPAATRVRLYDVVASCSPEIALPWLIERYENAEATAEESQIGDRIMQSARRILPAFKRDTLARVKKEVLQHDPSMSDFVDRILRTI
jgi:hypothetical protein